MKAEELDQIMRDADGHWPRARDEILARVSESNRGVEEMRTHVALKHARRRAGIWFWKPQWHESLADPNFSLSIPDQVKSVIRDLLAALRAAGATHD